MNAAIFACGILNTNSEDALANMLAEISTEGHEKSRGMLSVLVVDKEGDMQPGPEFFELAKDLGRNTSDCLRCWIDEFNRACDHWRVT